MARKTRSNARTRMRSNARAVELMIEKGLIRNLKAAGDHLVEEIKTSFPPGPSRSAPGGIPHVQTGMLRDSIGWDRTRKGRLRVGPGLGKGKRIPSSKRMYPFYLEYGTTKMAPRPYLRPAYMKTRKELRKIMNGRVN